MILAAFLHLNRKAQQVHVAMHSVPSCPDNIKVFLKKDLSQAFQRPSAAVQSWFAISHTWSSVGGQFSSSSCSSSRFRPRCYCCNICNLAWSHKCDNGNPASQSTCTHLCSGHYCQSHKWQFCCTKQWPAICISCAFCRLRQSVPGSYQSQCDKPWGKSFGPINNGVDVNQEKSFVGNRWLLGWTLSFLVNGH